MRASKEENVAWKLLDSDEVVIPAHNEEVTISAVVKHFLAGGVSPGQLVIVDSGCTDRTIERARATANLFPRGSEMRVISASDTLSQHRHRKCEVANCDGELANVGKGAAMYAAALDLALRNHDPEARIFFFDGDIMNIDEVDPLGTLLKGWEQNPDARIVKLSSAKRENEGVLAGINALPAPWNRLADFAWPLCGQQSLRLYDLVNMPMPTHYAVEVAILAYLVEVYGPECFAQEPIAMSLHDEPHPDDLQRYTRMFTQVLLFLQKVAELGGFSQLHVCKWNHGAWRKREIGVPRVEPKGLATRETILIDSLLPRIRDIIKEAGK